MSRSWPQVPTWALALQLLLPPYNALYYGKQAVANYAVHYMLDLIGQVRSAPLSRAALPALAAGRASAAPCLCPLPMWDVTPRPPLDGRTS